ncbi:MAG: hypothetical protein IKA02_00175 [Clostridia bacterium]|nr:hypothetical protein [Clostridia bacterium]
MHKLAVPFRLEQIETYGIDGFIKALHDSCADTVFLSIGTYQVDKVKRKKIFESLRKNIELLKKENFTVGVWLWTFMFDEGNGYTHIKSINGEVIKEQVCPSDKDFCSFAYDYLVEVAKCQPDMIMFDDDFRYGFLDCKFGCTCHNHRRYMEEISGEKLPENLNDYILKGGSNKYRSAFLEANGHFLKEFACLMRKAVDSVNPKIRLGQCACMSSFDFDGVNAFELSKILAGDTKPFCRLTQ